MTRLYVKWFVLAVLAIAMDIANLFLAPLAVPFARDGWLPGSTGGVQ